MKENNKHQDVASSVLIEVLIIAQRFRSDIVRISMLSDIVTGSELIELNDNNHQNQ